MTEVGGDWLVALIGAAGVVLVALIGYFTQRASKAAGTAQQASASAVISAGEAKEVSEDLSGWKTAVEVLTGHVKTCESELHLLRSEWDAEREKERDVRHALRNELAACLLERQEFASRVDDLEGQLSAVVRLLRPDHPHTD